MGSVGNNKKFEDYAVDAAEGFKKVVKIVVIIADIIIVGLVLAVIFL